MNTRSILLVLSGLQTRRRREFSPSHKRNKIIARKIGFFLGAANKSKDEHDDEDEDDSLISGSGFHGLSVTSNFGTGKARAAFVVVREEVQSNKAAVGRKLIDLPGYVFRVFVTSRSDSALEIWRDWGGYSQRKPLFNSLLQWPTPISPKFDSPNENAA